MNDLSFGLYSIKKNIQSSAELRTSFLMNIIGMAINNTSLVILWGFFTNSVGDIGGWTVLDIVALQGFVALSYGFMFAFGEGIRKLPDYTSSGAFDRFLLSPKNLLVRIATSSLGVSALGDIIFGLISLTVYSILTHATFSQNILIILGSVLSIITFFSITLTFYSTSFLFVDSTSVTRSLFELFLTPALFHGGAFQGFMRFLFIFAMPSLLVGTLPVEIVKEISLEKLLLLSVLTVFWLIFSIKIFKKSIKKYESSNFMTFGS